MGRNPFVTINLTTNMKEYKVTYLTPESNYTDRAIITVYADSENDAADIACNITGIRRVSIVNVKISQ